MEGTSTPHPHWPTPPGCLSSTPVFKLRPPMQGTIPGPNLGSQGGRLGSTTLWTLELSRCKDPTDLMGWSPTTTFSQFMAGLEHSSGRKCLLV